MEMEREEGELTDEELEDVSDNSSLIVISGKSSPLTTGREPFKELSLTSVSDASVANESLVEKNKTRHRLKTRTPREINRDICRRHCKHRKEDRRHTVSRRVRRVSERRTIRSRTNSIRKQCSNVSSGSDSEHFIQDRRILKQLRDAVRISTTRNLPNCSLRTRLKRMIEPDSQESKNSNSEEDVELEALRDQALQSKTKNDSPSDSAKNNVNDEDLIELRLIALQSAVLKKHQNRRKRKEEQDKCLAQEIAASEKTDETIILCNGQNEVKNSVPDTPVEEINAIVSETLEEIKQNDLQVVSNNNEDVQKEDIKSNIEEDEDILRAMLLTSISKKIASKKSEKQINTVIQNNFPLKNKPHIYQTKKSNEIKSIKFPAKPIGRFVINVNSDSESDCEQTVVQKKDSNSNVKSKDLFDKSLSLFLQQARAKSETEHQSDIAKHLPRSQQLEYKRLKRKLQQLSTKKKATAKLKRSFDGLDENKKIKLTNINTKRNISRGKLVPTATINIEPVVKLAENASIIKTNSDLSEKKLSKTGRLQVKGKYEELTPLMTRVSEARSARDKAQIQVKQLINELRTARADLTSTHQTYSILMHQMVKAKSSIDKRLDDEELKKNKANKISAICTSTPNKTILEDVSCELSRIDQNIVQQNETQIEVCPEIEDLVKETTDEGPVQQMEVEECEPMKNNLESDLLKYTSPLDHMQLNREKCPVNPLLILCPYDLLGECRDLDCSFRHCGNAITD